MNSGGNNFIKVILFFLILWFFYTIRGILNPFIIAAIFAYFLNPAVVLITHKFKFKRTLSVAIVYITVVSLLIFLFIRVSMLLGRESRELGRELSGLRHITYEDLKEYPDWLSGEIFDFVKSRELISLITPGRILPYFSGAITRIGSTFIFLVAGFYFLKDGPFFLKKIIDVLPSKYRRNSGQLTKKINETLSNYLRGQIFLIIIMSSVSWLILSLIQVKYALLVGIFTGIAETVPIIGPIAAGAVAVIITVFDGVNSFNLPPLMQGLVVASIYLILRQLEDVFVIPLVLGKATKLHPLMVLFCVLVGGHLWGILGLILAVPFAALIKTLSEYYFEQRKL